MSETTEIITLPAKEDLPALFQKDGGIAEVLDRIEKDALAIHQDYSTDKGRKEAKSLAAKVSRSKTLIDEVGKSLTEEWRSKTNAVNALRNLATTRLDELRDKIKGPALEFEAKEAERVQKHMLALDQFSPDAMNSQATAAELQAKITMIEAVEVGPDWEEFEAYAREQRAKALTKYGNDLTISKAREEAAAELEALRAEKAAREEADRKAAEEKARAEAEAKAKAEAEEREKAAAERAAKEAEERHQKELAQAKAREEAAAQAERDRIAEEARQEEARQQKRKADAENRRRIRGEIVSAITAAKPANWEELVDAMIAGEIPHVEVRF